MINGGGVTLMFFVSYIKGLPKELDEASAIDGCGYFRYIFKILTPLMKPAISSMVILTTINVWNEIVNSLIFLSDEKLYPITRGLYVFKGQYSVQWTQLTAALIIVAMPLILLYLLMQRYIIDGVVAGGVKA
jgi:raffinose/stachyose/melibiose transport system permease protein